MKSVKTYTTNDKENVWYRQDYQQQPTRMSNTFFFLKSSTDIYLYLFHLSEWLNK